MHLATGAVVNAVWDLLAKQAGKPVWRLVAEMSPQQIVDIDGSSVCCTDATNEADYG